MIDSLDVHVTRYRSSWFSVADLFAYFCSKISDNLEMTIIIRIYFVAIVLPPCYQIVYQKIFEKTEISLTYSAKTLR